MYSLLCTRVGRGGYTSLPAMVPGMVGILASLLCTMVGMVGILSSLLCTHHTTLGTPYHPHARGGYLVTAVSGAVSRDEALGSTKGESPGWEPFFSLNLPKV